MLHDINIAHGCTFALQGIVYFCCCLHNWFASAYLREPELKTGTRNPLRLSFVTTMKLPSVL